MPTIAPIAHVGRIAPALPPNGTARMPLNSLELFAGAGGMALGVARAGFTHLAVVERDKAACTNLRENSKLLDPTAVAWPVVESDIQLFDYKPYARRVALLAGGPPCQPFSQAGKRRGHRDNRDMFPEAIRAVREVRPKAFIFENVRGILRPSFANYLEYLRLQLTHADVIRRPNERWGAHSARLEKWYTRGSVETYRVLLKWIDAADFGIPQRRQRVIIVGVRRDLAVEWSFPEPTHSEDALLYSKWVTKEYWDRHRIPKGKREQASARLRSRLERLRSEGVMKGILPWQTVRDAIIGLPNPVQENDVPNHVHVPGARKYPGHTGSHFDWPAKALKAGNHGVPGGENMLRLPNGKVRYFTLRECGRLQTFPDKYVFTGTWSAVIRQLGNAVPVELSHRLAESLKPVVLAEPTPG